MGTRLTAGTLKLIVITLSRMEVKPRTWGCLWREFSPVEVVQLLDKIAIRESRFWKIRMVS
jgi:hypothetical protein